MQAILRYNMDMAGNSPHNYDARLDFGEALRYYRDRAGMKQATLAEQLGITQGMLSRWENQREAPDNLYKLTRLAEILDVNLEDLREGRIVNDSHATTPDDKILALAQRISEEVGSAADVDALFKLFSGYISLESEEREHVTRQIMLLGRHSPHPPSRSEDSSFQSGEGAM